MKDSQLMARARAIGSRTPDCTEDQAIDLIGELIDQWEAPGARQLRQWTDRFQRAQHEVMVEAVKRAPTLWDSWPDLSDFMARCYVYALDERSRTRMELQGPLLSDVEEIAREGAERRLPMSDPTPVRPEWDAADAYVPAPDERTESSRA